MEALELPGWLRLARYRFELELQGEMRPPATIGSTLRGGFGYAFRRTVCYRPQVPTCGGCLLRASCPYAYIFDTAPAEGAEVLSKNADLPVPFVIEPPPDSRREYGPGDSLLFDLVLVGKGIDYLAYFLVAFQQLGEMGLGRNHTPFRLARVTTPTPQGEAMVFDGQGTLLGAGGGVVGPAGLAARAVAWPPDRLTVDFVTPTRLKHGGVYHEQPAFHVLARTLLRRLSALAYFHGGQRWEADFAGWIARAEAVRTAAAATRWVEWERYSTRQRQRTSLGGAVGSMTYEGDLAPFGPLLAVGEWVHAGKACVFGNGRFRVVA